MAKADPKRPINVNVCGIDWSVRWLDEKQWRKENLDDNARGLTRYSEKEVCILTEEYMVESSIRDSFMHEIQHVIWDASAIRQSAEIHDFPDDAGEREEYMILRMTTAWSYLFQFNPEVVAYLGGA